ncbi:MAG: hypothetical protein EZS28_006832 [Streblomastix strix]|uniref:Uncharacterized protein n=1 Tax=Streblomastix strix TaxID=222440 RepID=A0A5J4WS67_9EUKA|nr:MAG: hypothetical protein EZS28_006832 [Streblomastix strix]
MNKAIQCQDEGQMISIGNIIKSLTEGNPKKILYYDDITVVTCAVWIISYIVKAELEELEDGAQNPLHQQLTDNGTILQLITIFKDKDNKPNHIVESIAEVLAYLFKALPLPQDIDKEIIKQLKNEINFNELALLAECPDNHKAILHDCYELELFNDEDLIGFSLQQLNLVKNILKYGSFSNKKKVALAIKVKIENLINQSDIYFDDEEDDWDIKVSKQAKQVLSLIISVEEQIEEQGEYEEMNATQINTKKNDDDEEEDIDQLFNKIYNMDNIEEDEEEEEDNDDDEIDEIQQIINIQFYESQLNQSKRRKLNDD